MTCRAACRILGLVALAALAAAAQGAAPMPAAAPPLRVQDTAVPQHIDFMRQGQGWRWLDRYRPWTLPGVDLGNPRGLEQEAAGGGVELSLQQTLELVLANDLDIAGAAYNPLIAETDYYRTLSGGASRGVAGSSLSTAAFSGSIGAGVNGGGGGGSGGTGSVTGGSGGVHGGGGSYEPTIGASWADEHARTPLNSSLLFGTNEEIQNISSGGFTLSQSFTTGTGVSFGMGSTREYINSNELLYNPYVATDFSIGFQQNLLAGASRTANRIFISAAQNTQHYTEAVFRQQVETTVAAAAEQYWALAAAQRELAIAREAQQSAQQLVDDTQGLVTQGRAPDYNLIQARQQLNTRQQTVLAAQTSQAKQASLLKQYLVKQLTPEILQARFVAAQDLPLPGPTAPEQQLIERAVSASPVLEQGRWNLRNSELTVEADKTNLLPQLTVFGSYTSDALAGVQQECALMQFPCPVGSVTGQLTSGGGKALANVFSLNSPDYGFGLNLYVPIFNREARADEARAELELSQARVSLQSQTNQVAQQVNQARLELEGETAALNAARDGEDLARQAQQGEQEKYRLGTATVLDVAAAQNALADAQNQVVTAQLAFATAQVELAKTSGTLLNDYHVTLLAPGQHAPAGAISGP